jgi:hypothetical protein
MKKNFFKKRGRKTNHTKLPEYWIWNTMWQRCEDKKATGYINYGARGITVCREWSSFEEFLKDMGPRPSSKHMLDRINNELGYSKQNCRWATRMEQQNNRRNNIWMDFRGKKQTLAQWALELGIADSTIRKRLDCGWSHFDALSKPVKKY